MTDLRLVRDPSSFEEAISLISAGVGAVQAATNLTPSQLDRLNRQLTRLQLVTSEKWMART